jgi:hypothetical protein
MELKIIEGNFYQGEFVTVSVGGVKIKRKVHYSGMAGDLYIWYKNNMYFYSEFTKGFSGDEGGDNING